VTAPINIISSEESNLPINALIHPGRSGPVKINEGMASAALPLPSEPYDPYISLETAERAESNQRTAALQAEIDMTVGIMRDSINKVSERGERLDSLQDKTGNLGFRRGANRVRSRRTWGTVLTSPRLWGLASMSAANTAAEAGMAGLQRVSAASGSLYNAGATWV